MHAQEKLPRFSIPPNGRGIKLQIQCWHVFVPEYHNSSKGPVPDEYNEEVDMEQAVKVVKYQPNEIPDLTRDDLDNSVLEVGMYNVKEDAKFEDTSFCRAHRNEFGTPSNIQGKPYSAYVQQKAKDENERVILGDISRLFNYVAAFAKDNKLKKKLTEEKPEINPQGAADPSDLWDLTTDHTSLYLQNQQDPNVEITSPYPMRETFFTRYKYLETYRCNNNQDVILTFSITQ